MSGFTKIHIRSSQPLATRAAEVATTVADQLARRATSSSASTGFAQITDPADKESSGLTPVEVGITLAVLFGAFLLVLTVGLLCKIFNKPVAEAAPYRQGKLYQPSAAGYGSRSVMSQADQMGTPNFSSRVSLLGNAGPMGYSGFDLAGDTSLASHDSRDTGDTSTSRGHTRGHSSGIQLPGATMAASRKGAAPGARHPTQGPEGVAPDGSGYRPPYSNDTARRPSYSSASGMPLGASAASQPPAHARVGLGPPPAADGRRRSRYSRGVSRRVDSVGPGTLRKSLYMGMEDDAMNAENYNQSQRSRRMSRKYSDNGPLSQGQEGGSGAGLRRVDSVGKGDHRRRSMHRVHSNAYSTHRGASIYSQSGTGGDRSIMRSAQTDNFGAGRPKIVDGDTSNGSIDPLNVSRQGYLKAPQTARGRSGSYSSQGSNPTQPLAPSRQYSNQSSPGSQQSNTSLVSSPNNTFLMHGGSPRGTPSPTPNSAASAAAANGYFGSTGSPSMRANRARAGPIHYANAPYPTQQMQLTTGPGSERHLV